jgi:hypothetical protein
VVDASESAGRSLIGYYGHVRREPLVHQIARVERAAIHRVEGHSMNNSKIVRTSIATDATLLVMTDEEIYGYQIVYGGETYRLTLEDNQGVPVYQQVAAFADSGTPTALRFTLEGGATALLALTPGVAIALTPIYFIS